MDIPTSTSLTFLSRLRLQDEAAWRRFVDVYGPFLRGRLKRSGLCDADADDVLQDVFATVARKIGDIRKEHPGDSFLRWLQTITSSRLIDFLRSRQRQPASVGGSSFAAQLDDIADPFAGENWASDRQVQQTVLSRILQVLKTDFEERTWKSFYLFAIEGKSTEEISHELKMNAGAIRQARSKVRKRLKDEFQELLDDTTNQQPLVS